jgi:hypothetical protein
VWSRRRWRAPGRRTPVRCSTPAQSAEYDAALAYARATRDALPPGPARDELSGVIANAEALAASGQLTSSRPPRR